MKHQLITPPSIPLVDNFAAPEVFVTGISGCGLVHNTVLLTLENIRCDHSHAQPTMERVVAARLSITLPAAQAMVLALNDYLCQQGVAPSDAVASGATRQ